MLRLTLINCVEKPIKRIVAYKIIGIRMSAKPWDLSKPKEKFCYDLTNQIMDEGKAVGEYVALALDSLKLDDPQKEAVSILLEKLRDDEKSHKDALEKVVRIVCPIK